MIILPKSLPFHSGEVSPVRSLHLVNDVSFTCTCKRVCVFMMAMVRAQRTYEYEQCVDDQSGLVFVYHILLDALSADGGVDES